MSQHFLVLKICTNKAKLTLYRKRNCNMQSPNQYGSTVYQPLPMSNPRGQNRCYINSTVQALNNCEIIYQFLQSGDEVQSLILENFNEQQIAKIEKSNEILNILQNLSKCDNDGPKNTEILREKIPQFDNTDHQDAGEFLVKLAELCKPLGNFCTYRVRKSLKCKNCNHEHDIEASNDDVHISFEEPIPSDCRTIEEICSVFGGRSC